jgi:acetolactate synthase-1/2/3 large subunit
MSDTNRMNAASALVATLAAHGVDRVFCVPGESYLPVLDALDRAGIHLVTCRHEGGAGFMALADAKLTRRPGIAFVSRGPGAANASIALHLAAQDFAPLVLFVGQVERGDRGRAAFQEVDYAKAFGGLCKGAWEVTEGSQLAKVCAQALALACDDLPGPVVISMPEDMLLDEASGPAAPLAAAQVPVPPPGIAREVADLVSQAKRPLLLVGSGIPQDESVSLVALSEAYRVPVVTEWKQQHLFPNRHPNYAGHLGNTIPKAQLALLARSDLILALGCLFDDLTTQGYRFPDVKAPAQKIVLVHPARAAFVRAYKADLEVHGRCAAFVDALLAVKPPAFPEGRDTWIGELNGYVQRFMAWKPVEAADGIVFGAVMSALSELLPRNGIITHDAGNFSAWMHRHLWFHGSQTLLGGIGGAMGLGIPAAIAASLRYPQRKAVCLVGDGGALMTGAELATAMQYGAKPLIILANNNSYGTIRAYQQRLYPGRLVATDLRNPDFVAFARSFGVQAWRVDDPAKIREALSTALAAESAALLEVTTSVTHISAYASAPTS